MRFPTFPSRAALNTFDPKTPISSKNRRLTTCWPLEGERREFDHLFHEVKVFCTRPLSRRRVSARNSFAFSRSPPSFSHAFSTLLSSSFLFYPVILLIDIGTPLSLQSPRAHLTNSSIIHS